jgi:hypothetical protein
VFELVALSLHFRDVLGSNFCRNTIVVFEDFVMPPYNCGSLASDYATIVRVCLRLLYVSLFGTVQSPLLKSYFMPCLKYMSVCI